MSADNDALRAADTEADAGTKTFQPSGLSQDALIILPVRNLVLFPETVFPVTITRERSVLAAQQALREERPIGVLMQRSAEITEPSALDLHRMLIGLIERGETERLHIQPCEIALNRFSINSICWFGKVMAGYAHEIGREEEEELSLLLPMRHGLRNCFAGNTIAAHFAFIFQRSKLERSRILEEELVRLKKQLAVYARHKSRR